MSSEEILTDPLALTRNLAGIRQQLARWDSQRKKLRREIQQLETKPGMRVLRAKKQLQLRTLNRRFVALRNQAALLSLTIPTVTTPLGRLQAQIDQELQSIREFLPPVAQTSSKLSQWFHAARSGEPTERAAAVAAIAAYYDAKIQALNTQAAGRSYTPEELGAFTKLVYCREQAGAYRTRAALELAARKFCQYAASSFTGFSRLVG